MDNVYVKELTSSLKALAVKKVKAECKAEGAIFLLNYRAKKREEARGDFWKAVRKEFKELADMDCSLRYDDTIVFTPHLKENK